MKKIILFAGLLICAFTLETPKERIYTIQIQESDITAYWAIIHNQTDDVKVGEYKRVLGILESQITKQYQEYAKEDSIKAKADSIKFNLKPKK